jgi:hypothetical protein
VAALDAKTDKVIIRQVCALQRRDIRHADGEQKDVLCGTLRISLFSVVRALIGMRASGGPGRALKRTIAFNRFVLAKLASVYLGPIRRSVRAAA